MIPTSFEEVTHESIQYLAPNSPENFDANLQSVPFESNLLNFLDALSKELLSHSNLPEIVALGFWLRSANIESIRKNLCGEQDGILKRAVGLVVHYAPSNVDTMFMYSWVCSLLMGNANIIRVSQSASEAQQLLLSILNRLFEQKRFSTIAESNLFCTFVHNDEINMKLCSQADARVIWGGDETVNRIKRFATPLHCRDVVFADKYSAAVINGSSSVHSEKLVVALAKDMLPFEQLGCSSPRVLFCLGGLPNNEFWDQLNQQLQKSENPQWRRNEHLIQEQHLRISKTLKEAKYLSHVSVFELSQFKPEFVQTHIGHRLILAFRVNSIDEVLDNLDSRCQTLSYFGVDKSMLVNSLAKSSINNVDRCVPVGTALDFGPVWDGYNLMSQLSRSVVIN